MFRLFRDEPLLKYVPPDQTIDMENVAKYAKPKLTDLQECLG